MRTNSLPVRAPLGLIGALLLTVAAAIAILVVQWKATAVVERFYAPEYAWVSVRQHLPGASKAAPHTFLIAGSSEGAGRPCPVAASLITAAYHGTESAIAPCSLDVTPVQFAGWLRHFVYGDQTVSERFGGPVKWLAAVFPLLLIGGIFYDVHRRNRAKAGRQIRGPRLVTAAEFNRLVQGDGFAMALTDRHGKPTRSIAIQRRHENHHFLTMADPGSGKTTAFMQLLDQVQARGETAIVYDPHQQFTPRYFDPDRGDLIINPLDARCPSWNPSDEINPTDYARAEANALAMANSLFPGKPTDRNWFFTYCSQQIWKHLLVEHQPDAHELAFLMQHSDPLIDMVVKDTELQQMLAQNAEAQRAGVMSHLTQVAYALRQIPAKKEGRAHLVLRDWSEKRRGWLFFTNTQDTRDGLRPMQSLMLDWLILCLLSQGERPDLPSVFAAFDELQTLQQLGQLVTLLTEGRKALRVAFAIQGRSQVRTLYGEQAEVLLSAPYTKLLLRTSEPEAAEWLSKTIGDVEIERVRESRPAHIGARGDHSYSTERVVQRLMLASEFHGLEDLNGVLKYGDLVLKVRLPRLKPHQQAPAFIPREGVPLSKKPLPSLDDIKAARKAAAEAKKAAAEVAQQADKARRDEATRAAATIVANGTAPAAPPATLPVAGD